LKRISLYVTERLFLSSHISEDFDYGDHGEIMDIEFGQNTEVISKELKRAAGKYFYDTQIIINDNFY